MSQRKQPVYVWIVQPKGWDLRPRYWVRDYYVFPFSFRELVWHLSTQVNGSDIAAYITVFDLRRVKRRRFIPFLVDSMVYMSIASKFTTLATLSPWYESVRTHNWSPFLINPILRWHRTAKNGILINWYLALHIFGSYQPHRLWT